MKKLFEISNVFNVFVPISPTKVVFTDKDRTLYLRQSTGTKNLFPKPGAFQALNQVNNTIWGFEMEQLQTIIFDIKHFEFKKLPFVAVPFSLSTILEEKYAICALREGGERFSGIVDIKNHEIIKRHPSNYGINGIADVLNENMFISKTRYQIACHSFADGSEKWKFDYKVLLGMERADVYGGVYYHDKRIFFVLTEPNQMALFCADADTGFPLWKSNRAGWPLQINHKLYLLHGNILNVLDMNTLKITAFDFQAIMEACPGILSMHKYLVQDNVFYFVIQPTPDGNAAIGAICLETKELLSYEPIPIEKGSYWILEIRWAHGQLYVLTQGGTLHVFQQPKAKTVTKKAHV